MIPVDRFQVGGLALRKPVSGYALPYGYLRISEYVLWRLMRFVI